MHMAYIPPNMSYYINCKMNIPKKIYLNLKHCLKKVQNFYPQSQKQNWNISNN